MPRAEVANNWPSLPGVAVPILMPISVPATTLWLTNRFLLTIYDAAYPGLAQRCALQPATLDEELRASEALLVERGFRELGSDTYIDNRQSQAAHLAWGFSETERVVYFLKILGPRRVG